MVDEQENVLVPACNDEYRGKSCCANVVVPLHIITIVAVHCMYMFDTYCNIG